ncbi:MAG: LysM peptidoglycan-binding domain-containing protein [Anaerolineae bacterium]|nr:LysM peptidoglycan-binding domain-containing protein [Anaerolineae bacterium]
MHTVLRSLRLMPVLLAVTLALSGCFQPGGEGIPPTPIGEGPIVPATPTPLIPSETPVFPQGLPTPIVPTAEVIVEETPALVAPADAGAVKPGVIVVTETPVSAAAMTATALIAQAQAARNTQVAAQQFVVATATLPALEPSNLQAGEMTATAMIIGATETAYIRETMTATAMGVLPPVTMTPIPGAPLAPALATSDCVHVVQRGQNVYRIALRYGVTIADIARANGLANSAVVRVGQELVIPGCGNLTPTPGIPGQAPPLGEGTCGTHLIQPGENLYRIALRYGVTMAALRNANGISNVNVIRAGDTLVIPCR